MRTVSVVIGRFQPLHNEHQRMIEYAKSIADRTIVLIGSSYEPRSLKNPWTEIERCQMLRAVFGNTIWPGYLRDFPYDDEAWFYNAQSVIESMTEEDEEVIIVGCNKDATTFYLDGFPQYKLDLFESNSPLNATDIRIPYFDTTFVQDEVLPYQIRDYMLEWSKTDHYDALAKKLVDVNKYQEQWGKGPFLCVDAIIEVPHEQYVIIRHNEGTLALPGGFLDKGERSLAGARRECLEEVGFDPGDKPTQFFIADNPSRDERCHNVSHVYVWRLDKIPALIAGDDAQEAMLMDWNEIQKRRTEFRADHFHLIEGAYFNA